MEQRYTLKQIKDVPNEKNNKVRLRTYQVYDHVRKRIATEFTISRKLVACTWDGEFTFYRLNEIGKRGHAKYIKYLNDHLGLPAPEIAYAPHIIICKDCGHIEEPTPYEMKCKEKGETVMHTCICGKEFEILNNL